MPPPAAACVVIPTLNEIDHIAPLLDALLAEPSAIVGEILVADGGSTDGTRDVVTRFAHETGRVRLIDNPQRLQSAGINRAVALADPALSLIVRIDAHADYPPDYVERVVTAMAAHQADSVVVRLETVGETPFQRAVAAACNSKLGTGGAAHRVAVGSGYVDHGHHAGFRRALFERIGGYDQNFEANEDAELDARLRAAGGRIWLDADIPVRYYPRRTLAALGRQYRRYGSGRARTFLKHRERLRIRQMLPPIVVVAVIGGLLLAPLQPAALILPIGYALVIAAGTAALAWPRRSAATMLAAPALVTMHFAWGIGFIGRIIGNGIGRKNVTAA